MSFQKSDLISYRLEKSKITFEEAKSLANSGFWNGAANRLYYSCFYSVIALLASDEISAITHNGVRTEFFKNYIKNEKLDKRFGSLFTDLMSKREESDYDDFQEFTSEDIMPYIQLVEEFNLQIYYLIKQI